MKLPPHTQAHRRVPPTLRRRAQTSRSMDALLVLGAWLCALLFIIFVLLFGQNAAFAHTPLPRLHWLVTRGLCHAVRCGQE